MKAKPPHRLNIDFSDQAVERIEAIKIFSDAASTAEVIRNALRLYDFLLQKKNAGWSIQIVKDDKAEELIF